MRTRLKVGTRLHPFKSTSEKESAKRIDFELNDYLRLMDLTGRAVREDKKGATLSDIAPILTITPQPINETIVSFKGFTDWNLSI